MPFAPVPSSDEIVSLYEAGELAAELARYHEKGEGEDDPFVQRCITLHNNGSIDLLKVPSQPAFSNLPKHAFFTAQHLYCKAIPKLDTNVEALMECCRILIDLAGNDGAATEPNRAFCIWCQNNPDEGATVIRKAQAGDGLAKQFVTFALQAANDVNSAINFIGSYTDKRRLSGMAALGRMTFPDTEAAQKAIAVLEPFVANPGDDHVRTNALLAAFDVLKTHNDPATAKRLIEAAAREAGSETLHGLAQIVWLNYALLEGEALETALLVLQAVNPEHLGTVQTLDLGLSRLLDAENDKLALDFLTEKLRDGKLTVKSFEATAHKLKQGNPQRLYELIVRWFLSGNFALCDNASKLFEIDAQPFDTTVKPLGLASTQQIFLCRKAIGFLFVNPVVCCSIIVSVLRAGDSDVEDPVTELLFDPLLLSYGGEAKEYLERIPTTDPAYGPIQNALSKAENFYAGLEATGTIKELHPSEYQRDVVHQRTNDMMQAAHKSAESQSVLLKLVHRSTILYGKRALTYFTDHEGNQHSTAMELQAFGTSVELPRLEILDPVGLNYMLRVFRAERLK